MNKLALKVYLAKENLPPVAIPLPEDGRPEAQEPHIVLAKIQEFQNQAEFLIYNAKGKSLFFPLPLHSTSLFIHSNYLNKCVDLAVKTF